MIKVEYVYSGSNMQLELVESDGGLSLVYQNFGNSKGGLFSVSYSARLSDSEIENLRRALVNREKGKQVISKELSVKRDSNKYAIMELKFSKALENIPLPRDVADTLIEIMAQYID